MKALVIGGDGMLGKALITELRKHTHHVARTTRRKEAEGTDLYYLDLMEYEKFQAFSGDVIYLVAAITKVVDCEAEPARTWRVNADAQVDLARRARRTGMHPIFVSSDAVERAPSLNYSRQKAYVESYILANGGTVVRPSRIPPEEAPRLADLMMRLGFHFSAGLYRWSP